MQIYILFCFVCDKLRVKQQNLQKCSIFVVIFIEPKYGLLLITARRPMES